MSGYKTDSQPHPVADGSDVQRMVIADIEARRLMGIRKYGVPLGVNNGRDHLVDAYDEVLDLAVYLRAEIEKRNQQQWSNFRSQGVDSNQVYGPCRFTEYGGTTVNFGAVTVSSSDPSRIFNSSQSKPEFGE